MPQLSLLVIIVIAVVNALIFYAIIRAAISSGAETQKRLKHAWAQTELLMAIARKSGVEDQTIFSISQGLK